MTATELCNLALTLIGEKRITDVMDTTDTSRGRVLCYALYELAIKEIMIHRHWACARDHRRSNYETATATITNANPGTIEITSNEDYYRVGDRIAIVSATSDDSSFASYLETLEELYLDTNAGDDTYDLIDEDDDDIDMSGYTDNATCVIRINDFKYQYRHALPSDFLAVREVYGLTGDWEIIRKHLYCDAETIHLIYTKNPEVTDISEWLLMPIAYNLAAKLVTAIKGEGMQDYTSLIYVYLSEAKKIEARHIQERDDPDFEYAIDI